ncbi:MAG: adenosine deaminase [Chloroflexi bacterium]|nr:adenosine deaminase [Chloroflexota bacterium]
MSLESYVWAAPKAELHLHLEGAIRPTTILTLARRNGVQLPSSTVEELRDWFHFRDFAHFGEVYSAISRCLRTADDYELIAFELAEELARQNARYAEVGFLPAFHARMGVSEATYLGGLSRARERAQRELGVEMAWIFDLGRAWKGGETETRRWATYAVDVAIDARSEGVVALGLGGSEVGHPPEQFGALFDRGRAAGLHSAPHAGELVGPASIRGALDALGAERIAHGVRAIEDHALLAELAARQVALDVCPTSNVCLGVYSSLAQHPLPRLHAAGAVLTISTDDPALFGTTLNGEVALLADPFALGVGAIDDILLNGVRHSFLPARAKQRLEATYRAELDVLKAVHLGTRVEDSAS